MNISELFILLLLLGLFGGLLVRLVVVFSIGVFLRFRHCWGRVRRRRGLPSEVI